MVLYSRPRTKTTSTKDCPDRFGTDRYRNTANSRLPVRQIKQEYRREPAGPDSPPLTLDGRALHFCLSFSFQLFFLFPFFPYASVVFVPIVFFSLFSFPSVCFLSFSCSFCPAVGDFDNDSIRPATLVRLHDLPFTH